MAIIDSTSSKLNFYLKILIYLKGIILINLRLFMMNLRGISMLIKHFLKLISKRGETLKLMNAQYILAKTRNVEICIKKNAILVIEYSQLKSSVYIARLPHP